MASMILGVETFRIAVIASSLTLTSATVCEKNILPIQKGVRWICSGEEMVEEVDYGGSCRAKCMNGHEMKINVYTTCTPLGWVPTPKLGDLTQCSQPTCPYIGDEKVSSGIWNCEDHLSQKCSDQKTGTVCKLKCQSGATPRNGEISVCTEEGWKPDPQTMECVGNCDIPKDPENGHWACRGAKINNQTFCLLNCDHGYKNEGEEVVLCEEMKSKQPLASCKKMSRSELEEETKKVKDANDYMTEADNKTSPDCPSLPKPDFGTFECAKSECHLKCNAGYTLDSPIVATCHKGEWCSSQLGVGCKEK